MKRIIFILTLPIVLFSQERLDIQEPYNNQLNWISNFTLESNGLGTDFIGKMIFGGYINNRMKDKWINSNPENNIIFSELVNKLEYQNNQINIKFSISDVNNLNCSFSDDLMRLIFYGNYNYQNKILDFSKTSFRLDRYQQFKLSYLLKIEKAKIILGGSYISGYHHSSLIINEGMLFTDSNGIGLDINYDIHAFTTDSTNFNTFKKNGNGLAFDLKFDFEFKNHKINVYLEDLGFIMWNTKSLKLVADSSFRYNGIEIHDILSFNDSLLEEYNSIDYIKNSNQSIKSYIPANLGFSIERQTEINKLKNISTGVNIKWQPYFDNTPLNLNKIKQGIIESNYKPYIWISAINELKYFNIIPSISYGGFNESYNFGLAFTKGKKHKVILRTQNLQGILFHDNTNTINIYINITSQF